MSNDAIVQRIERNPKYKELVRTRSRFAWLLSAIMLAIYCGFILTIAFSPKTFGIPLSQGDMTVATDGSKSDAIESSTTTIGIPIGIAVIVSAFLLTGIYVSRANGAFDTLTAQVLKESK